MRMLDLKLILYMQFSKNMESGVRKIPMPIITTDVFINVLRFAN